MRLWSIHPEYLDSKGLVALWREGLLAQKVLQGGTRGYKNHPQLTRFKNTSNPLGAIATYLRHVVIEAEKRGYSFDKRKILKKRMQGKIPVTDRQIEYEYHHLLKKLENRDPEKYQSIRRVLNIKTHPLFKVCVGNIEAWEAVERNET